MPPYLDSSTVVAGQALPVGHGQLPGLHGHVRGALGEALPQQPLNGSCKEALGCQELGSSEGISENLQDSVSGVLVSPDRIPIFAVLIGLFVISQ